MTELARAAYSRYLPRMGREPAPITADYAEVIQKHETWVAEGGAGLIGLLVLCPYDGYLLLENIAVSPDAQRSGIGKRLLDLADERAQAIGVPEIRLYTNATMTENLAYYPRHGYHETHRTNQDGFHRVFFAKPTIR